MSRTIYIYGLIGRNVAVKGIRYIGITDNPEYRLSSHRKASETTDKAAWVSDLALSGDTVDMIILDQAETRNEARKLEASWIKFAEERGWELTNTIRPSSECLPMPEADDSLPLLVEKPQPIAPIDMTWRLLELAFDNRRDLSLIRDEVEGLRLVQAKSRTIIDTKPPVRDEVIGGVRQAIVAALLLLVSYALSVLGHVLGVDFTTVITTLLVGWILFSLYPLWLVLKMCAGWLFGYNTESPAVNGKLSSFLVGKIS